MTSKIDAWDFFYGNWESLPDTQVGEADGAKSYAVVEPYPSNRYISFKNTTKVGEVVNSYGMDMIYFDEREGKYRLKSFFGFGFVVNYIEIESTERCLVLKSQEIESQPKEYDGTEFRYTITKETDRRVDLHLEMTQPGQEYFTFWRAMYEKQSDL